jgi:hypothetical protein
MPTLEKETAEETLVATFPDHDGAVAAAHALDEAGISPAHVGVVADNVRQAREAAGSFSPQGAVAGAAVGALVAVAFVVAGGDAMRQNVIAILLGAPGLIVAFAAIGALAGRARVLQRREYGRYEREVEMGEALVTVSGDPGLLARAREVLRRRGATTIRREDTGEAI